MSVEERDREGTIYSEIKSIGSSKPRIRILFGDSHIDIVMNLFRFNLSSYLRIASVGAPKLYKFHGATLRSMAGDP